MATDVEKEKVGWLLKRLVEAEDFCRPYFDRAKRYYKLYRFASAVNSDDWPYVNKVRSRDILAMVEDSTALMVQTLFARLPFFSCIPREREMVEIMYTGLDPIRIADQIERVIDYQISHEDTEFFPEMVDFFKGGCMLGNSYIGVYPKFDDDGQFRTPLIKAHDYWDVMPISGARRLTKSRGVFIRDFVTMEDLVIDAMKGNYRNVDQVKAKGMNADPDSQWHDNLLQELGVSNWQPDGDNIELLHYFSGGHVISVADRKAILRDSTQDLMRPYPYDMPVCQYKYMPVPLEFFAMGIPEVLEVLQEDKNLIRSARRDNIDLVINKVLKARTGGDINFDLIRYYPGAIWPLENLQDIEPVEISDVTQSSYQEESLVKADMENALSLFGYARGMTPAHTEQPTTVMKLQQASLNRTDLAVKMAEFTILQNIATRMVMLVRRYMQQGVYEAIVGGPDAGLYRMSEQDVRRFFLIKPVGSSITNIKEIRQQQIMAAIQLLMGLTPDKTVMNVRPYTVDYQEVVSTALDALDLKNADRILVSLQQNPMMGAQPIMGASPMMGPQAPQQMSPTSEADNLKSVSYGAQP